MPNIGTSCSYNPRSYVGTTSINDNLDNDFFGITNSDIRSFVSILENYTNDCETLKSTSLVERYKKKNIKRFKLVDFLENKNVKS